MGTSNRKMNRKKVSLVLIALVILVMSCAGCMYKGRVSALPIIVTEGLWNKYKGLFNEYRSDFEFLSDFDHELLNDSALDMNLYYKDELPEQESADFTDYAFDNKMVIRCHASSEGVKELIEPYAEAFFNLYDDAGIFRIYELGKKSRIMVFMLQANLRNEISVIYAPDGIEDVVDMGYDFHLIEWFDDEWALAVIE